MSINLLDLVKDQVSSVLTKQASSFLGESESSVAKALGGIMPTLLGSLVEKSTKPNGGQGIMDMISGLDLNNLGNITGLFGGGTNEVNGLLNSGNGLVDSLLGNKTNGVIDLIASMSGLKTSSSSSLLKMAAPLLMGVIGKQVQGKGLSFLTDLLLGQKSSIAKALPAGIGSLMGFSSLGDIGNLAGKASMPSVGGGQNKWLKWLLPALLAFAVLYYLGTKGCGTKVIDAGQSAIETTTNTVIEEANSAVKDMSNSIGNLFSRKLSTGFELLNAAENGIESQLITFIEDNNVVVDKETWFNFDRLLFDTNKATLQPQSQEQLENIAEILKAFPNVNLKIGGYTDNTGDPKSNLKLSTDRAYNVMSELIKLGIDKSRLAAEGYGDKHPVADNATEEGRQLNRRISARVSKK